MFTGIVTDIGEVLEVERRGDLRARIGTGYDVGRIDIGASIAWRWGLRGGDRAGVCPKELV